MLAASLLVAAPANATLQGSQVISLKPGSGAALSKSPNEVFLPMAVRFGTTGERLNIFFSGTQYYPPGSHFISLMGGWKIQPMSILSVLLSNSRWIEFIGVKTLSRYLPMKQNQRSR